MDAIAATSTEAVVEGTRPVFAVAREQQNCELSN
jgi:hypothetical protein